MTQIESKEILTKRLENLLGFDDGTGDVLEHLLSIESHYDLKDYLVQLLGQGGENVISFVDDVGKFQRGETVKSSAINVSQEDKKGVETLAENENPENYIESSATKRNNRAQERKKQNGRGVGKAKTKIDKKQKAKPVSYSNTSSIKPNPSKMKDPALSSDRVTDLDKKVQAQPPKKVQARPPKKSQPTKGKASYVCGCFGTVHKPLTNCLYCGRISCVKEGYDFCPFCGIMLEKVESKPPDDEIDKKAWLHKERLLTFDREFARRTVIWDDQEDYYASSSSAWLSTEEQAAANSKEENRNSEMHQHKKQTLDIVF
eukprot:CAMPEP_0194206156 /NCGR_PEP_ID=MMETSP0156-20130528/5257_1 /TAXON_ID=33649 /ORGANISM="Thalassionema nitzschioides, Strain L26-B" /LENGTH=315 /DNA_ID=CAMNT_0038932599 /DNA_START=62 /DNA_END=1009 /DNA_ORIENTATION=-